VPDSTRLRDAVPKSPLLSPGFRDSSPHFGTALSAIINNELHPAIKRYCDFLEHEYLAGARDALGVSKKPNGVEGEVDRYIPWSGQAQN
jgi:uncharacterized protein (DUF885 family)